VKLILVLFIGSNIIPVIYVDDCLFFAKDASVINDMIANLCHAFKFQPETDVTAF